MPNIGIQAIYEKCRRVIRSCRSVGQLIVAARYVALARRHPEFSEGHVQEVMKLLDKQTNVIRQYATKTKKSNVTNKRDDKPSV
jgi:hypothetical protein